MLILLVLRVQLRVRAKQEYAGYVPVLVVSVRGRLHRWLRVLFG